MCMFKAVTAFICVYPPKAPRNIRLSPVLLCDIRNNSGRGQLEVGVASASELLCSNKSTHVKNGYVHQIAFSVKCVCTPPRIRHLCSTESLVCVPDTVGCLFNDPSSAPSSCWWWSLLIMEPENTRHSFTTLSVARSWA